ncbi:MAG: AraC family transcriptional regulator ligand-binding domain-containing protein [Alsobacter sp.]
MQRVGVFAELPSILSAAGVDPMEVFEGLDVELAGLRHDTKLPIETVLAAFDRASRRLSCPHLGLLVGARFSFAIHGPIGRLMKAAATLEDALMDFVTWQQGYSNAAVVYLNKVAEGGALGYGAYVRSAPGSRQLYDCVMTVACRMVSDLTGGKARPVEVLLSHSRPDDVRPYLKHLTGPVRFNQVQSCVVLDERTLKMALPGYDPAARLAAHGELEALAATVIPSVSAKVAHRMKPLLHLGIPDFEAVAEVLNLHPRTLRRRLKTEGTTFEDIRDQVRFALARELLDMTDLPIGEISEAVAFSTHTAFVIAFRRWTGTTPSQWRASRANLSSD